MLIKVLDIVRDKTWECKQIYFKLRTNTTNEGFLLSVSIENIWVFCFGYQRSGELSLDTPLRLFDYISSEDEMSPWFAFADEVEYLHRLLYAHPLYGPFQVKYEPQHDKTSKMTCAPSKDSVQPGHSPSLIRVFAVRFMGS